jgi:transposase
MKNKTYTQEFRDSTVQLVINSEKPTVEIAKDLDINSKTLYSWVRIYKESNAPKPTKNGSNKAANKETFEEEAKRLRVENKLLKQERDILKKATAYFAKEVL